MTSYPFVYWAQDEERVFLSVDLRDATNTDYSLSGNVFEFRSIGTGAQGRREYCFELDLFDDVSTDKENNENGQRLTYSLKKKTKGWWPTVTKKPTRISWLRVDFDKFKDPDESDDDFEMLNSPQRMAEREMDALTQQLLKENISKPKSFSEKLSAIKKMKKECNSLIQRYLFVCNATIFLMHFYLLAFLIHKFVAHRSEYLDRFWIEKGFAFRVATALQLLDVAHAAVGITKSSYQTALVQVVGRLFILLVIDGDEELHTSRITFGLMVVYFLIEMFRYPYYALGCLKINFWVVTWLRYTAWIPLYPTGLLLEAITIYRAIPYYYTNTKYSIEMPNIFNIAFNFGVFLTVLLMFVFPFIAYHLLLHMRLQSVKKLNELKKKKD